MFVHNKGASVWMAKIPTKIRSVPLQGQKLLLPHSPSLQERLGLATKEAGKCGLLAGSYQNHQHLM